jgi:SAM-dependent methyltransferase
VTDHLRAQYATPTPLRARTDTHRRFTVGPDLESAVDAALALRGTEALLDMGCGPGDFLGRLRQAGHTGPLRGLDASAGMLDRARTAHPGVTFVAGDAQALPFADGTLDVVTARHMLYHVPDIAAALREARRVLKPGGTFLAVTNTRGYLAEWWNALEQAATDAGLPPTHDWRQPDAHRFTEYEGQQLTGEVFGHVEERFVEAALLFPTPESTLPYFSSLRGTEQPDARLQAAFLTEVQRRSGSAGWRVSKRVALLLARK